MVPNIKYRENISKSRENGQNIVPGSQNLMKSQRLVKGGPRLLFTVFNNKPNQTSAALTGRGRRLRRWMTTAPAGFEPSLQALQHGGGPAVVRWQTAADGGKNSRGGGEALTGDCRRLRQPFDSKLAPFSSFFSPLQNPVIKSQFQ